MRAPYISETNCRAMITPRMYLHACSRSSQSVQQHLQSMPTASEGKSNEGKHLQTRQCIHVHCTALARGACKVECVPALKGLALSQAWNAGDVSPLAARVISPSDSHRAVLALSAHASITEARPKSLHHPLQEISARQRLQITYVPSSPITDAIVTMTPLRCSIIAGKKLCMSVK